MARRAKPGTGRPAKPGAFTTTGRKSPSGQTLRSLSPVSRDYGGGGGKTPAGPMGGSRRDPRRLPDVDSGKSCAKNAFPLPRLPPYHPPLRQFRLLVNATLRSDATNTTVFLGTALSLPSGVCDRRWFTSLLSGTIIMAFLCTGNL